MTDVSPSSFPLYRPEDEHDGCGVGFIADTSATGRSDLIARGIQALENLQHRGAAGADAKTGDGAGLLFGLPHNWFAHRLAEATGELPAGPVGVGVFFWPRAQPAVQRRGRDLAEEILISRGIEHFFWRTVPVRPDTLGVKASENRPHIEHLVVGFDDDIPHLEADRRLYAARREFEARTAESDTDAYIASMSTRTIVYKALIMADGLADFYPDLERDWPTKFVIFHQRFSTNTLPTWPLAQPFRRLGHNGEINTLTGNANNTEMREEDLSSPLWDDDLKYIRPLLQRGISDSAMLDNVLEFLNLSGRSVPHCMAMLIPQAFENDADMPDDIRAFYEYHACINEPWDGPAAVVYSDGDVVGAHLDRNGLRPLRYQRTDDGLLCVGSEVGVLDLPADRIVERGRLGPGHMLVVDLNEGKVFGGNELKSQLASQAPYRDWLQDRIIRLEEDITTSLDTPKNSDEEQQEEPQHDDTLVRHQIAFGYSREEMRLLFEPMTSSGAQPISSMGDDTPIAVLSRLPRLLPTYFKQRFAQVTNPPIDPIRESSVMSLSMHLGRRRNWLDESPKHSDKVELPSPILTDTGLEQLRDTAGEQRIDTLNCTFSPALGSGAMVQRIDALCEQAEEAVDNGRDLLILSDRAIDKDHAPIPILLAVGAITTHLLRAGKRLRASIIVESGEPRDVHHFATLIGYGASAVVPYLAIETILDQCDGGGEQARCDIGNFIHSIEHGLLKVMSKMGISVLGSYRGAQIFEILGLAPQVVDRCFPHTPSPIGGIGFDELTEEATRRHLRAYGPDEPTRLTDLGYFRFRRGGESHAWGPKLLGAMTKFRRGDKQAYRTMSQAAEGDAPMHIRDLMDFEPLDDPVPVEEVEPAEVIRSRFTTAAMSLGALSPEAHESVAIAMNRIGGKSNSGEGGEDPTRYLARDDGDSAEAAIKQVASARFGVTPEYLGRATELEIKMAQGSKPGEGGQLPGHKVTEYIARLRHSTPGVPLISPPPHHDIYSIEDLAQLIYDLKTVNPDADVCVKLVAESGVGTIAAGVAKAWADTILISGHDGGTGASPLSSIKNAGNAWEIGLAETQQVLRRNGLRERVKLRVDGGLKTGRDIVIAAMLGAEEFNFGTAALIALGCRYVRQCHQDTCPVGIATQREDLREKFEGEPENLVAYFNEVAQEIRQILAALGARSLDEVIGRTEGLKPRQFDDHSKASSLDIRSLLADTRRPAGPTLSTWPHNTRPEPGLNDRITREALHALKEGARFEGHYAITNRDRTIGARLAGQIAVDDSLLPDSISKADDPIRLTFQGTAGQSFGAFTTDGMTLILDGEANDYVAKGLGGGCVVVRTVDTTEGDILVGNTVLYGATGGELYIRGRAGERFAVRNSGATAVVEGVGDHGCEYMTSGTVVVLGETGRNFGAGMTGGIAYVYDPDDHLLRLHHPDFVALQRLTAKDDDSEQLADLLRNHLTWTDSPTARRLLDDWRSNVARFWRLVPRTLLAAEEGEQHQEAGGE